MKKEVMKLNDKEFNLLEEKWIKVIDSNRKEMEVSIKDIFRNAETYLALAGEMETQNAAVLRFLLSIVITVLYRYDCDGNQNLINDDFDRQDVVDRWTSVWKTGRFNSNLFCNYLDNYQDSFWLFHPTRPFYQVPNLQTGTEYKTAQNLLGDLKESNNPATKHHFGMREGKNISELTYSEAARWLIHFNGYAVNLKWDKKAGNGKNDVTSSFVGQLGRLGFIAAIGSNLFETLMLNATLLNDGSSIWKEPHPVWEHSKVALSQGEHTAIPDNLPQLFTVQSRRISLFHREGKVVGYRAMLGEDYDFKNSFNEQMTVWVKREEKTDKSIYFVPKLHNAEKQAWREFPAIFNIQKADRTPGLILWLQRLENEGVIRKFSSLRVETVGQMYDGMRYLYTDSFNDRIDLSFDLLLNTGQIWVQLISEEIELCNQAAYQLRRFSEAIISFIYGSKSNNVGSLRDKLASTYYQSIDASFRNWLFSIKADDDNKELKISEWHDLSRSTLLRIMEEYVLSLNLDLFEGKTVNGEIITPGSLINRFTKYIYNIYPNSKIERDN